MANKKLGWIFLIGILVVGLAISWGGKYLLPGQPSVLESNEPPPGMAYATFGGGCFWCTEAVFQQLKGVKAVVSGYSGGTLKNPTYDQICTGTTGHAEATRITFDPALISYEDLLEVFWKTHDPTTKDRQGRDEGPQYRSVIFYHDERQKKSAQNYKDKLDAAGVFEDSIVTEIVPAAEFFRAEPKHQNFYLENPRYPYCVQVIGPKLAKMKQVFADKLQDAK